MSDINDDLVGKFATYLGEHARLRCNPEAPLLRYLSALGYLSGFKNWFLNKYKEEEIPRVFQRENFRKNLCSIQKFKLAQAHANNEVSDYVYDEKIHLFLILNENQKYIS